jgi:hypothetical protein
MCGSSGRESARRGHSGQRGRVFSWRQRGRLHGTARGVPFLRALAWLAILVALLCARPGLALAQPLTWLLDPGVPAETRERIVGQTSDLPFVLLPLGALAAPQPAQQGDPLGRATRLAVGTDARVVVWTVEREGGIEVTIVDLEARRVLLREVPASGSHEHSAALETVGVIVRAALQALAEGGEIGVATAPPTRPPMARVETPEAVVVDRVGEPVGGPLGEGPLRREIMLGAGLGLRFVVDDGPAFDGSGSLALRYGRLWLGTAVHASARQRVRAPTAAISVAHAGASLEAGVVAFERGAFALVPVVALSVGRVRRETTRVADGFVGTGSRAHLDVRAGAGLRLRVALGAVAWLTLDARLELLLQRVLYTVNTDAGASTLARTPRAAPAFGLAVLARIGRVR